MRAWFEWPTDWKSCARCSVLNPTDWTQCPNCSSGQNDPNTRRSPPKPNKLARPPTPTQSPKREPPTAAPRATNTSPWANPTARKKKWAGRQTTKLPRGYRAGASNRWWDRARWEKTTTKLPNPPTVRLCRCVAFAKHGHKIAPSRVESRPKTSSKAKKRSPTTTKPPFGPAAGTRTSPKARPKWK